MLKIMKTIFGSHLYGLDTPESDTDYKGIYLPTLDELLLNSYKPYINLDTTKKGKNTADDVDMEWIALPTFITMACKGETIALDMLHSDVAETYPEFGYIWSAIQRDRSRFYTKGLKSYAGYLKGQVIKYGKKGKKLIAIQEALDAVQDITDETRLGHVWYRLKANEFNKFVNIDEQDFFNVCGSKFQKQITVGYFKSQLIKMRKGYGARALKAEAAGGYDWKAVSHSLRAGYQLMEIYKEGVFHYPLAKTDFIKQVKNGEIDYETVVEPELNRILAAIAVLVEKSKYLERVDNDFWDDWIIDIYEDVFNLHGDYND